MTALVTDRAIEGIQELHLDDAENAQLQEALNVLNTTKSITELARYCPVVLLGESEGGHLSVMRLKLLELIFTSSDPESGPFVLVDVRRRRVWPLAPKAGRGFYGHADSDAKATAFQK